MQAMRSWAGSGNEARVMRCTMFVSCRIWRTYRCIMNYLNVNLHTPFLCVQV